MSNLFLIFNHRFSTSQEKDAGDTLGVERIIPLPPDFQNLWSDIPADIPEIDTILNPVRNWLLSHAHNGDYVLIQGDFGACYLMVNFCFEHGFIPIYSTTQREVQEEHAPDGSVKITHYFQHQIFRKYGR